MNLVAACQAFVHVSEKGSFTLGAAAARIPQPVASRRIAALERHLGARLLDRSARRAQLTPFGRAMLPSARQLVRLAEVLDDAAEHARNRPLRIAVPDTCATLELARLRLRARRGGIHLELHTARPAARAELLHAQEVEAALLPAPAEEATWRVPLGVAGAAPPSGPVTYLESLRAGRAAVDRRARRVWIQPEDDVPHVRDRLTRLRDAVGLRSGQVAVAPSLAAATADVLDSPDLLLAAETQAEELGLFWSPVGEEDLTRGIDLATAGWEDAARLRAELREAVGRCLGAAEGGAGA